MKIAGIQKLSLVDFDGHISSTIFTSGCNFACTFCHNSSLIPNSNDLINECDILNYLQKRKNMLDSVCITGGEPTLHKDLPEFISKIKEMGYLVKLDTNGTNPEMVKYLVENELIDYIAMDIKNIIDKYTPIIGLQTNENNITKTINKKALILGIFKIITKAIKTKAFLLHCHVINHITYYYRSYTPC